MTLIPIIKEVIHFIFQSVPIINANYFPAITYEALTNQLTKHGGLLENLSISIDRWLVPLPQAGKGKKSDHMHRLPHQLSAPYIKNNYVYLIFMCLFVFVNLFLFITRAYQFRKSNYLVIFARACGRKEFAN